MAPHIEVAAGLLGRLVRSTWLVCRLSIAALLLVATLVLVATLGISQTIAQPTSPMSSKGAELDPFEQRVREYLLNNPKVIMEALQILQDRQRAAEAENLKQ
jgi:hypothetical protein